MFRDFRLVLEDRTGVSFPPSYPFFKLIIEQWQAEIVVRDVKIVGNSDPCTRPLEAPFKLGR